ncbi:MAG: carboxymuconolactone decarboxylase family protein [Comamonadaceae bacterium]|nr:MAG: carboxymuconolactone decarboxylase family protein [Comamonadaceae bacterium]
MKSRLPLPAPAQLDAAQRAIHDSILATRGSIDGPFLAWLHAPGLAEPAQRLGAFCRYGTALALVESELLILTVAGHFHCIGEQQIHEPIARSAGLADSAVAALAARQTPTLPDARQRMLWTLASALLQTHRIPQPVYDDALALFGERTLVEVVGILGYYALVAMTLNAFEMRKE